MPNNKKSNYPEVEINLTPNGYCSSVKIDGENVPALRSIDISARFDDITTFKIEVLGRISTKLRGKVHVIESIPFDENGKEIKIGGTG